MSHHSHSDWTESRTQQSDGSPGEPNGTPEHPLPCAECDNYRALWLAAESAPKPECGVWAEMPADQCHETIVGSEYEYRPCAAPAVGVAASVDDGSTYPICAAHYCGGCGMWHERCTERPVPLERTLLLGFIGEVRLTHAPLETADGTMCEGCSAKSGSSMAWPCDEIRAVGRVEELLRETLAANFSS